MSRILNRALLVEGNDDKHVIQQLLAWNKVGTLLAREEIIDCTGYESLIENLELRLKTGGPDLIIGAVVDADTDPAGRWQSIRDRFSRYAKLPDQMPERGLIISTEREVRFGLWLMPDNRLPGMLEDFYQSLIPEDDHLIGHARATVAGLPPPRRFSDRHEQKAVVHSWLAWQEDPGTPLGLSIRKTYADGAATAADPFMDWMRTLFAPATAGLAV